MIKLQGKANKDQQRYQTMYLRAAFNNNNDSDDSKLIQLFDSSSMYSFLAAR